jgi:Flp pilus assembly pilin Flp
MFINEAVRMLKLISTDRKGVTAVEYAVIVGVLVAVIATAFGTLATHLNTQIAGLAL